MKGVSNICYYNIFLRLCYIKVILLLKNKNVKGTYFNTQSKMNPRHLPTQFSVLRCMLFMLMPGKRALALPPCI
jgi:hypothetical protein